jgi:alpha-tubulin suppressor-like RCC1 family protein
VLSPRALLFFLSPPLLVLSVSAGLNHSAVLAGPRRELFTFGAGQHGQLGHGNTESLFEPRAVETLFGNRLETVSCGGFHTLALSEDGLCWSWGENEFGQLGDPRVADDSGVVLRPTVIMSLEKVGCCILFRFDA